MRALSFDDVCLVPNYNGIKSRKDVTTTVHFGGLTLDIPIISAAMDTITGSRMASKMRDIGGIGFLHRFCSIEDNVQMYLDVCNASKEKSGYVVNSLGINENMDRFRALHEVGSRYFSIDTAHAHNKHVGNFIKQLKEYDPRITIIAGSVCTYAASDYLASCGADIIRVGIGPSSVCQTRIQTGFGVPQFDSLLECSRVARPIICDGGIRSGADAVKAFVAGATYIMCGSLLSGTDETPGEVIEETATEIDREGRIVSRPTGAKHKIFRGMASREAQEDFYGKQDSWKTAEGIQVKVPYKGSVANIVSDLMGGIRSGMTYGGCSALVDLKRRVQWREISPAGYREGTPYAQKDT